MWVSIVLPSLGALAAVARFYVERYERVLSTAVAERQAKQLQVELESSNRQLTELRDETSVGQTQANRQITELREKTTVAEGRADQLGVDLQSSKQQVAELREKTSPRRLTATQRRVMRDALAPWKGESVALACKLFDAESCAFAQDIEIVFREAGWHVQPLNKTSLNDFPYVVVFCNTNESTLPAFEPVMRALSAAGLDHRPRQIQPGSINGAYPEVVHIIVGSKH